MCTASKECLTLSHTRQPDVLVGHTGCGTDGAVLTAHCPTALCSSCTGSISDTQMLHRTLQSRVAAGDCRRAAVATAALMSTSQSIRNRHTHSANAASLQSCAQPPAHSVMALRHGAVPRLEPLYCAHCSSQGPRGPRLSQQDAVE